MIENKQFKCYYVYRLVSWPTVNGAGSTLHVLLFSLQTARSYGKRVLSHGHGAKGPGSDQNYPCHLNIHASFQHPSIKDILPQNENLLKYFFSVKFTS